MSDPNVHDFVVTAVEPSDEDAIEKVVVTLTDARGGKVRLHLSSDMAESLRRRVSAALDKSKGHKFAPSQAPASAHPRRNWPGSGRAP